MNDILKNNLYPHDGQILNHFKNDFEFAFISFLPFFKMDSKNNPSGNFKKAKIISLKEAKEELNILENFSELSGTIYSYSNKDYPADSDIFLYGKQINWLDIINKTSLKTYANLNKALRTSIGALRKIFQKPILANELELYTAANEVYHPTEGDFCVITKRKIFQVFKNIKIEEVIIFDEFQDNKKLINVSSITEMEFVNEVESRDHHILSSNGEILFTIEWDSFFFIIAFNSFENKELIEEFFEGFFCDDKTEHEWDYENGEISKILKRENKKWWQFWI